MVKSPTRPMSDLSKELDSVPRDLRATWSRSRSVYASGGARQPHEADGHQVKF